MLERRVPSHGLEAAGFLQSFVSAREGGTTAKRHVHFSISWPGTWRKWSQPTILLSEGIYSLAPAPFLFAPRTPTQSERETTA